MKGRNIASNHMQTATGVSDMSSCHYQEIQLRLLKEDLPIYFLKHCLAYIIEGLHILTGTFKTLIGCKICFLSKCKLLCPSPKTSYAEDTK